MLVTIARGKPSWNFMKSIREKEDLKIIGTDSTKYKLHLSIPDKKYLKPRYDDSEYKEKLSEIINKESIEFVHA